MCIVCVTCVYVFCIFDIKAKSYNIIYKIYKYLTKFDKSSLNF